MRYHKICKDCVLSGDCLLQDNDDVELCEDVVEAGKENKQNDKGPKNDKTT